MLLDFDYPSVLCNNRGQGTVRLLGVPFLLGRTPSSSHVRFHLPTSSQGELTAPAHPRVQVSRSQPVSDLQHRPPTPSLPAPVSRGQGLSVQDIDLLSFPCGLPTPWDSPHPALVRGGGGHCPCLPAPYPLSAHCCQPTPKPQSRLQHQHPCHGPGAYAYIP